MTQIEEDPGVIHRDPLASPHLALQFARSVHGHRRCVLAPPSIEPGERCRQLMHDSSLGGGLRVRPLYDRLFDRHFPNSPGKGLVQPLGHHGRHPRPELTDDTIDECLNALTQHPINVGARDDPGLGLTPPADDPGNDTSDGDALIDEALADGESGGPERPQSGVGDPGSRSFDLNQADNPRRLLDRHDIDGETIDSWPVKRSRVCHLAS